MVDENQIQAALTALRDGTVESSRKAAYLFNVPRTTLDFRRRGGQSHKTAHTSSQLLSIDEEKALEELVLKWAGWGWPVTIEKLNSYCKRFLDARGRESTDIGKNWYKGFLRRHPNLHTIRAIRRDQARCEAASHKQLEDWFGLFHSKYIQHGITPASLYNVDEKGCLMGFGENQTVIVSTKQGKATTPQPGNRDWTSIIECVNAEQHALPPYIIFKGKLVNLQWKDYLEDPNTKVKVSENGWTDNSIALDWLHHFDNMTKLRTAGKWRMLLVDGHGSHISLDFAEYCFKHNIVALCLPAHSTHLLQPLDVGIFASVGSEYRKEVSRNTLAGQYRVTPFEFLKYYQRARRSIVKNIAGAWRGAGLVPLNPEYVLAKVRPVTPPSITLQDSQGNQVVYTPTGQSAIDALNEVIGRLRTAAGNVSTPQRSEIFEGVAFVKTVTDGLTAKFKAATMINEDFLEAQKDRVNTRRKRLHQSAFALDFKEMSKVQAAKEAKEAEQAAERARKRALLGKVGFAKRVWTDMPMMPDLFDD